MIVRERTVKRTTNIRGHKNMFFGKAVRSDVDIVADTGELQGAIETLGESWQSP